MHVRILTLNVWNSEGDPRRPESINRALATLKPDLIAFQEVMQTPDSKMLDRLLASLDFDATHQADVQHSTPPFADRYGGSAVATRWPHQMVEILDMRVAAATDVPWATDRERLTLSCGFRCGSPRHRVAPMNNISPAWGISTTVASGRTRCALSPRSAHDYCGRSQCRSRIREYTLPDRPSVARWTQRALPRRMGVAGGGPVTLGRRQPSQQSRR